MGVPIFPDHPSGEILRLRPSLADPAHRCIRFHGPKAKSPAPPALSKGDYPMMFGLMFGSYLTTNNHYTMRAYYRCLWHLSIYYEPSIIYSISPCIYIYWPSLLIMNIYEPSINTFNLWIIYQYDSTYIYQSTNHLSTCILCINHPFLSHIEAEMAYPMDRPWRSTARLVCHLPS